MYASHIKQSKNKIFLIAIAIFLISYVVRLFFLQINFTISRDGAYYIDLIRETSSFSSLYEYVNTDEYFWVPPLYIYLIKTTSKIFNVSYFYAGVSISLYFGSLIPVLFFLLSNKIFSRFRIVLLSTAITVFNPTLVYLSYQIQRESIFFFLLLLTILFLMKSFNNHGFWNMILCGVSTALCTSIRFEGLELLFIIYFSKLFVRKSPHHIVLIELFLCTLSLLVTLIIVSFIIFNNLEALYIIFEHYKKFFIQN